MAFTGNLNAVALTDIVQLIGLAQRSGTLTVVTGRGRFTVLFCNGYVVDASAVRFARRVAGSEPPSKGVHVRANLTGVPSKGVGLAEMAGKIFRISTGHFTFQTGEPQTNSGMALDVSGLLLESFRQQDEAARAGAVAPNDYDAQPADKSEKGMPADMRASREAPKPNPMLRLLILFRALSDGRDEATFERVVLEAGRDVFDRAILFRVREAELRGVGGYRRAPGEGAAEIDEALRSVSIPLGTPSAIQDAVDAGHIAVGEAAPGWWMAYAPQELGPPPDTEYVAIPVMAGGTCVMVLYGDGYAHREFADPLRALEVVCKHVGTLLENEMLKGRRPA